PPAPKPSGIAVPPLRYRAAPRAALMVASVAMKAGSRHRATTAPFSAPHRAPLVRTIAAVGNNPDPCFISSHAETVAPKASSDPTLKSMPPATTTAVMQRQGSPFLLPDGVCR